MESTMLGNIFFFIIGLILLYMGAEFLVRGSSRLALLFRISPIVIGLTVVAFGTSFPEFITSMVAAWQDKIDLAIGNIVGSNIANICLILGISGLVIPITIDTKTVKKELYWMMAASVLFWIFGMGGTINHIEGAVLFSGIIVFTLIMIRTSLKERQNNKDEITFTHELKKIHRLPLPARFIIYSIMTIGGILLLMFGSDLLIKSATYIARALGVSEVVIGLSLVAFGTSLPELATAIIAIIRKENEILVGNIVGSNIFNILFVGGVLSAFFTAPINQRISTIDTPIMLVISLFLVVLVLVRKRISHLTGFFLFIIYIIYIIFTFLNRG
jgi:cation:H+ antiporter